MSTETLEVAESEFIDDADESIQLKKGVLKRGRREQYFLERCNRLFNRMADLVGRLIDVAQSVRLIHHDQVPICLPDVGFLRPSELEGANHYAVLAERIEIALANRLVERSGLKNCRWKKELVGQLLTPLLAEIRRADDQKPTTTFSPPLG